MMDLDKFKNGRQCIYDTKYHYILLCQEGSIVMTYGGSPFQHTLLSIDEIEGMLNGDYSYRFRVFDVDWSVRNVK